MRNLRFCSATFGLLLLVAASQPVEAICGNARLFGASESYIYTPGVTVGPGGDGLNGSSITANFGGAFWALGSGDPELFSGNDNGAFPALTWVRAQTDYPAFFASTWAASSLIDGCIDNTPVRCMVIQFTDVDPQSGEVVFALLSKKADIGANYNFNQPDFAPINLAPLADPQIVGAAAAPGGLILDVAPLETADFAAGLYLDPECGDGALENLVPGACWLTQVLPGGSMPPTDTDLETGGWSDTGVCSVFGEPVSVPVDCEPGSDVYVAYVMVNESDIPFDRSSRPSTRVECATQERFARFEPRTAKLGFSKHGDSFRFSGRYKLADASNGISADREDVTVFFGTYSETIPAGSFSCRGFHCVYRSHEPGISYARISRRVVTFHGSRVDLSNTANPVVLGMTLGDDFGEATIRLGGSLHFIGNGHGDGNHGVVGDSADHDDDFGPALLQPRRGD